MSWKNTVETITYAGMLASLPGWVLLATLFHFGGHGAWRRSALGRNLMTLTLVVVWFHMISLARRVFGDYLGRNELVALGTIGVAVIGWHRVLLWLDEYRRNTSVGSKDDRGQDVPQ